MGGWVLGSIDERIGGRHVCLTHPFVLAPTSHRSQLVDGTHKESTPMKVAFLTNDKAQAAALKKALNEPESEEATEMLAYVAVRNVVS